jgi:CRISPR-associated endoribonuclease Cas6
MRIIIHMRLTNAITLPFNHSYYLCSVIYRFLETSDSNYSEFLHNTGYSLDSDPNDHRRFKLFVFSPLRAKIRRIRGSSMILGPGPVEWRISSPMKEFLGNFALGLMSMGGLHVCHETLPIVRIETLDPPEILEETPFTCLSPIVVSVTENTEVGKTTRYLRPTDPLFSERVRLNLISKYIALHQGAYPANDAFEMTFDPVYLEHQRGTKMIDFKGVKIIGAYAPFLARGSKELMEVGYSCGFGEKNSAGFGMGEVMRVGK